MDNPVIRSFGESAVLLSWTAEISPEINEQVRRAEATILQVFSAEIVETVVAYAELAVYLKVDADQNAIIENLRNIDLNASEIGVKKALLWQIPVCYSTKFGMDMMEMSLTKGISVDEIIHRHTSVQYPVYLIGFLPGFLYLGDLPKVLYQSRKETPVMRVPSGSVAIGGEQTGIYPMESPGGWNIIGQTPVQLFDVKQNPPVSIKLGDKVQFVSISTKEFEQIKGKVASGSYHLISKQLL